MKIDNGQKVELEIAGVFVGTAGMAGGYVSFVPNLGRRPNKVVSAVIDGESAVLWPVKDAEGPFWTARYEIAR